MGWMERNHMICVPVYADSTGEYTDEECNFDNCVEIPVPEHLMLQFFSDIGYPMTKEELDKWQWKESTCDDTVYLINWLVAHNYTWKRLK